MTANQNPEQLARDAIDKLLLASGWLIQNKSSINLADGVGVAVREYQTNVGPADYILFVSKKPFGVIEAKHEEEGVAFAAVARRISGIDNTLTPFDKTVDKNFQEWIFKKQAGTLKYTEEQLQWLRMIKDYIANSFHVDRDDFELDPFNKQGGLGKMWQLFGEQTDEIIKLN